MEPIKSPFGTLKYVGDLLSTEYPTTIVYQNVNGEPVIVEWLDDVELIGDYFIIYKVDKENLFSFIQGTLSHLDLIKSANKRKYFEFYGNIEKTTFKHKPFKGIKKEDLPRKTSYFDSEYSLDFSLIVENFGFTITEGKNSEEYFTDLKEYSKDVETGLFRLHFLEGSKVGHGTADTKVLGRILLNFEDLYHEVALDSIQGVERNPKTKNLPEDISVIDMSSTELYIQEAASFSIYLKPKTDAIISQENGSVSDKIFKGIDDVITSSGDKNKLESIKTRYSSQVFQKVAEFTQAIYEEGVKVDLDYYNSNSQKEMRYRMKPSDAHTINNNIISYSRTEENKIDVIGKFSSLNTTTGHFAFKARGGQRFTGYFSELTRDSIALYNFKEEYKVVITQSTYKALGHFNRIKFELESCQKID